MNVNSLIEDLVVKGKMRSNLSRKERDKELRKSDIMSAAERVFALKGYHQATIHDIARAAQYAIGTVYLYFKDKEVLYFSLLEEKMRNLTVLLKESVTQVPDAEEKLRIFVKITLNHFQNNQDFFRILFSERTKGQILKEGKISHSPAIQQHKEIVIELIRLGQQQKVLRSDFSSEQISDILAAIFMTVVFDWLKERKRDENKLEDIAKFILDIFLNGAGRKR